MAEEEARVAAEAKARSEAAEAAKRQEERAKAEAAAKAKRRADGAGEWSRRVVTHAHLLAFYRKHDPSKVDTVAKILKA